MKDGKKSGGGKLSRSETVTVRLEPKLKYLADIAARKQRRTLSSFIEWSIEKGLDQVSMHASGNSNTSVAAISAKLWSVDHTERMLRLAILYPDLLTYEEQEIWKIIVDSRLLTPAQTRRTDADPAWDWAALEERVFPAIRSLWKDIIAAHEKGAEGVNGFVLRTKKRIEQGEIYKTKTTSPKNISPKIITSDFSSENHNLY